MSARILFVASGAPNLRWGGGARRTYQLLYELRDLYGQDAVAFVESRELDPAPASLVQQLQRKTHRAIAKAVASADNPYERLVHGGYGQSRYLRHVESNYRRLLERNPNVQVCIFEHLEFAELVTLNRQRKIKTVIAPWGLISLLSNLPFLVPALAAKRQGADTLRDRMQVRSAGIHLANEIMLNASADKSWFLSKVESGLWHGLGLHACYMPYYAAGEAAAELDATKRRRQAAERQPGLFIVNGGNIDQNRLSLDRLVRRLSQEKLPAGARIVVVGTDKPPDSWQDALVPQVEFKGFLPQDEYEQLLVKASGVLVPQVCGFGCLTRIIEMSAAGIPVIADAMAADATGEVPGVRYIGENGSWGDALQSAITDSVVCSDAAIIKWMDASRGMLRAELSILLS